MEEKTGNEEEKEEEEEGEDNSPPTADVEEAGYIQPSDLATISSHVLDDVFMLCTGWFICCLRDTHCKSILVELIVKLC